MTIFKRRTGPQWSRRPSQEVQYVVAEIPGTGVWENGKMCLWNWEKENYLVLKIN